MTPSYPSSSPALTLVHAVKGISSDQLSELQSTAERLAQDNIGMPSIYVIAVALQEWLTENNVPGNDGSMYSDMIRREQKKVVEEKKEAYRAAVKAAADSENREPQIDKAELERLQKRQAGVAVTVETFMAWKVKFDEEMSKLESMKKVGKGQGEFDENKISGKQWFLALQASGKGVETGDEEERLIVEGEKDDFEMVDEESLVLDDDDDDEEDEDYVPEDEADEEEEEEDGD